MNKKVVALILFIVLFVVSVLLIVSRDNLTAEPQSYFEFFIFDNADKYKKAVEIRDFQFPEDFGSHPEFLTEWWYYTGNLLTPDQRHFGYQLTFFRRAISGESNELSQSN